MGFHFESLEEKLEIIKISLQKYLFRLSYNIENKKYMNPEDGKVKTPDLSLPEFYGSIEHRNNFKVLFGSLISNNMSLSDTQRLFYLHSALKGVAIFTETSEDTFQSLMTALLRIKV